MIDTSSAPEGVYQRDLVMPERASRGVVLRVLAIWLLTRAALVVVAVVSEAAIRGDVTYYGSALHGWLHGGSLGSTLTEYPLPALGILLPQYLVAGGSTTGYLVAFFVSMLVVDAAFTWLLFRSVAGHRRHSISPAMMFWLWVLPILGPIVYLRFDLVPACLVGAALMWTTVRRRRQRPATAGVAIALGAAIKLWPVVALPMLLLTAGRRRLATGFVLTAAGVGVLSLAVGGWGRLTSPLHWQSDRGLQIESVVATPFMVLRALNPHGSWRQSYTQFKAYELSGPGTAVAGTIAQGALIVALLVLAWLWLRARRAGAAPGTVAWLVLVTTLLIIVTDKALSPQYLLWAAAPLAALLVLGPHDRDARAVAAILALAAALTQVEYPLGYASLIGSGSPAGAVTGVLLVRNLLLLAAAALALRKCFVVTDTRGQPSRS